MPDAPGDEMREKPTGWRPCAAHSPDGDQCILADGHYGSHQRMPCNGTCDNCDCDFTPATDTPAETRETTEHFVRRMLPDADAETVSRVAAKIDRALSVPVQGEP